MISYHLLSIVVSNLTTYRDFILVHFLSVLKNGPGRMGLTLARLVSRRMLAWRRMIRPKFILPFLHTCRDKKHHARRNDEAQFWV